MVNSQETGVYLTSDDGFVPLYLQLSMKGPPGLVGLTGRPGPVVSKKAVWSGEYISGDDSHSNSL